MSDQLREVASVRIRYIIGGAIAGALGWFCFFIVMTTLPEIAQRPQTPYSHAAYEVFLEFFKTVVIAAVVSFVLEKLLRQIFPEGLASRMNRAGIADVYPTRHAAAADIAKFVREAKRIDLMGISLRDFLIQGHTWSHLWEGISKRLISEVGSGTNDGRLTVRILMLHPKSSEGFFRRQFERSHPDLEDILVYHIKIGLEQIRLTREEMIRAAHFRIGNKANEKQLAEEVDRHLQIGFYRHCPFSFLFLTNEQAIVEQYYYKYQERRVDCPLLRYEKRELQEEFRASFEVIWKHAEHVSRMDDSEVGTAAAIAMCGIRNIYADERTAAAENTAHSGERKARAIASCGKGSEIRILSNSGKFYRSNLFHGHLVDATNRGATVKFLLLNPVCCQAILRAIADDYPGRIEEQLGFWDWTRHTATSLYLDTTRSISHLNQQKLDGYSYQIHLHHTGPACSLFLTPDQAFIDQYTYGRSQRRAGERVLAEDYPTINFGKRDGKGEDTAQLQLLQSHFDTLWNSYSIDISVFQEIAANNKLRDEFEKSLADIRRWFEASRPVSPAPTTAPAIVLAPTGVSAA